MEELPKRLLDVRDLVFLDRRQRRRVKRILKVLLGRDRPRQVDRRSNGNHQERQQDRREHGEVAAPIANQARRQRREGIGRSPAGSGEPRQRAAQMRVDRQVRMTFLQQMWM